MSYSTTHLAEIAAPADPGSYVIDPTPAMMGGGEASWSRGGDSLKHYGDEWTRSDGVVLVVTADGGEWIMGLYPNINSHDEVEAFSCGMWSFDHYSDLLVSLQILGIDTLPVNSDPARYGCASCQHSITENAAAGREASNTPACAPLLPARPLSDVDACGFPYCAECPPSER